ncbi:hypothetical protein L3V82_06275 [Thiotrichales bacterium 19S3-7]|nr:hypothetical protein [Thiotrichales bacterium 19S3-7]MCF6801702.1 hypothetical protein [Thiotrichales bacterium 19S3-11]
MTIEELKLLLQTYDLGSECYNADNWIKLFDRLTILGEVEYNPEKKFYKHKFNESNVLEDCKDQSYVKQIVSSLSEV